VSFSFTGFFFFLFNIAFRITSIYHTYRFYIIFHGCIHGWLFVFIEILRSVHICFVAPLFITRFIIVRMFRIVSDSDHSIVYIIRFVLFLLRFTKTTYVIIFITIKAFTLEFFYFRFCIVTLRLPLASVCFRSKRFLNNNILLSVLHFADQSYLFLFN